MYLDLPQNPVFFIVGAFLLGWILSAISSRIGARYRASKRDSRDDRIRELDAELRISKGVVETGKTRLAELEEQLKETTIGIERRDNVISEQLSRIESVSTDLKESVIKTRELRAELAERATENVHAEAKIREVETELSVAQASTDMIATGILDYSLPDDEYDSENASSNRENKTSEATG